MLSKNPVFESVTGLTNTTFDPENVTSGRGATEGQLRDIHDQCRALETQLAGIENSETLTGIINSMLAEVDDLRTMIDNCCYTVVSGGAEPVGGDGADVAVTISWAANPMEDGGQMTATSSGGADIDLFYFLVRGGDGVFLKKRAARYCGKVVTVNTLTGAITVSEGAGGTADKLVAGATDANGCEGLATFSVTAAPWYTPPSGG